MNIGYIYKITCLINSRVYVGSKLADHFIESYWSSSKNTEYWNDLNLYGKDNFKREILCWCKTREEMRIKEEEYILSENALVCNGGYNQSSNTGTIIFSEEVRHKMSISAKNKWANMDEEKKQAFRNLKRMQALDPNGKIQSKEYKENMRKISTGFRVYTNGKIDIKTKEDCPEGFRPGTCNPNVHVSRKLDKNARKKLSISHVGIFIKNHWWNNGIDQKFCKECPGAEWKRGRLNPHWNQRNINKHKCYCIEANIYFVSVKEAAIWLNIENSLLETVRCNITRCCNGKIDEIYGYHWKYVD